MLKHLNRAVVFLIIGCLLSCTTNPVTGKRQLSMVSESWELQTGEQYYPFQQQAGGGKYVLDPDLNAYVSSVGRSLAKYSKRSHLPYEFVVLNDSTPNAWALPGGKIAINRGLLTELKNEAELAAVLAHEIVHADAAHSAQQQTLGTLIQIGQAAAGIALDKTGSAANPLLQQGIGLTGLYGQTRHSRSKELEADAFGIQYMSAAGYDPRAAVTLQETFVRLSKGRGSDLFSRLFASHPPSIDRVHANEQAAWSLPRGGRLGEADYARETARLRARQPAYDEATNAMKAISEKNYEAALQSANQAIRLEPRESRFHELKGFALEQISRSKDALDAYGESIRLDPNYFSPLLRRGLLGRKLQSNTQAKTDLLASVKLVPSQVAYYALGEIEEVSNNCQAAGNYYSQAAQAQGQYTEQAQKKLAAIKLNCR